MSRDDSTESLVAQILDLMPAGTNIDLNIHRVTADYAGGDQERKWVVWVYSFGFSGAPRQGTHVTGEGPTLMHALAAALVSGRAAMVKKR